MLDNPTTNTNILRYIQTKNYRLFLAYYHLASRAEDSTLRLFRDHPILCLHLQTPRDPDYQILWWVIVCRALLRMVSQIRPLDYAETPAQQ